MVSGFERFILSITEIDRYWNKIAAEEMIKHGLKSPYAVYLIVLYKNKDGVTPTELCEICSRNKADVSRAMSDMQKKGLVVKENNGKNIYRARMLLTESGVAAAQRICDSVAKAAFADGNIPSDEQFGALYNMLELISGNLLNAVTTIVSE